MASDPRPTSDDVMREDAEHCAEAARTIIALQDALLDILRDSGCSAYGAQIAEQALRDSGALMS